MSFNAGQFDSMVDITLDSLPRGQKF